MFGDEITKEWLNKVAVKLHQCQDWYNTVMNPKVTNKIFELPVAAASGKINSKTMQRV